MQLLPYSCLWPETTCFSWIKITQGVTFHVFYFTRINWILEKHCTMNYCPGILRPWHRPVIMTPGQEGPWRTQLLAYLLVLTESIHGHHSARPQGDTRSCTGPDLPLGHLQPCPGPHFSPFNQGQPSPEDVDSHRLCSFYSSHPQQWDLGRRHCQKSVTRDLIRQAAFNLISSTTSTFFFL